jgi:hypothetical protein
MQRAVQTALVLTLILSAPLAAQTLVLEAEAGVDILTWCQIVHVHATCDYKHFDGEVGLSVGATVQFDGESFLVEWMGPGYYLESGIVLQPVGVTAQGLRGQRWLEISPQEGRIHTSRAWKDVDGNRALSASDTLTLETGAADEVKDVRLQLRVRRVLGGP